MVAHRESPGRRYPLKRMRRRSCGRGLSCQRRDRRICSRRTLLGVLEHRYRRDSCRYSLIHGTSTCFDDFCCDRSNLAQTAGGMLGNCIASTTSVQVRTTMRAVGYEPAEASVGGMTECCAKADCVRISENPE